MFKTSKPTPTPASEPTTRERQDLHSEMLSVEEWAKQCDEGKHDDCLCCYVMTSVGTDHKGKKIYTRTIIQRRETK